MIHVLGTHYRSLNHSDRDGELRALYGDSTAFIITDITTLLIHKFIQPLAKDYHVFRTPQEDANAENEQSRKN